MTSQLSITLLSDQSKPYRYQYSIFDIIFNKNKSSKKTFNKRQCLEFDNIFVAIPRRSVTFLLLLQSGLVIRINFVHKFTRHTGARLQLRCLFDDMYRNGTSTSQHKNTVPCAMSTCWVLYLAQSKIYYFCNLPTAAASTATNSCRRGSLLQPEIHYYRITSIPFVL